MIDFAALIARTAQEAYTKRDWWINDDPPATLNLLDNGDWYYTEHGQVDVLSPGERVVARIAATPLVLSDVAAVHAALAAAATGYVGEVAR